MVSKLFKNCLCVVDCSKICKGDYQKLQTKETAVHERTLENEDESEDDGNDSESLSSDSLESSSEGILLTSFNFTLALDGPFGINSLQ